MDPALQLQDVKSYAAARRETQEALLALAFVVVAVTASVLLLSAGGIYAMMSFTVVRRRREIGIRLALGADPRRLLAGIFARAAAQLGAGAFVGLLLATAIVGPLEGRILLLLPVVATIMVIVGLLAALGPARRGLAEAAPATPAHPAVAHGPADALAATGPRRARQRARVAALRAAARYPGSLRTALKAISWSSLAKAPGVAIRRSVRTPVAEANPEVRNW